METNPAKEAERILREFGVKGNPVPVEDIAAKLGAKLSYEPFEGQDEISGMLFRDGDHIVIGINSSHAKTRQRFSIAHEIGHLVMHKGAIFVDKAVRLNRDAKSSLAIDPREIDANRFAAELLMPEKLVSAEAKKRLVKKSKLSELLLIDELAAAFQVSSQAMEFRLTNLGIISPR
ncbi:MAG: ImmA/IrrE family metallo-endopeptidase [Betaproteobacteria bacterium]|nr:ImmA/IrrE family metallo-endopeptidase [Betaproteobacteria bacterium]